LEGFQNPRNSLTCIIKAGMRVERASVGYHHTGCRPSVTFFVAGVVLGRVDAGVFFS